MQKAFCFLHIITPDERIVEIEVSLVMIFSFYLHG